MSEGRASVSFDMGATEEEAASVQAAFDVAGVDATVSDEPYAIVASGELHVVTPFVVITATAASAFVGAFAAKAGQDGYDALKHVVGRLRSARARDRGRIDVIIRGEDGPDVVIPPDLPDGALARLLTEPLPPAPSGKIVYDAVADRWRDSEQT